VTNSEDQYDKISDLVTEIYELEQSLAHIETKLSLSEGDEQSSGVQVTGAWERPQINIVDLTESEILDLYEHDSNLLAQLAVNVSLTTESYRQGSPEQILLETHPGFNDYWVITTKQKSYLLPCPQLSIRRRLRIVQLLFNLDGEPQNDSSSFTLVKPAYLDICLSGDEWRLLETGNLSFYKAFSLPISKTKIQQLQQRVRAKIEKFRIDSSQPQTQVFLPLATQQERQVLKEKIRQRREQLEILKSQQSPASTSSPQVGVGISDFPSRQTRPNWQLPFQVICGVTILSLLAATAVYFLRANRLRGNFADLQAYLEQEDWRNADHETYKLMLTLAGTQSLRQGYFDLGEWQNFPCDDLSGIDLLWSEASNGELGFSAQRKVFDEAERDPVIFHQKVGWREEQQDLVVWLFNPETQQVDYKVGKEPNFSNPPAGHLPAKLDWGPGESDRRFETIIKKCNLQNTMLAK
jgi:hypothetical protein